MWTAVAELNLTEIFPIATIKRPNQRLQIASKIQVVPTKAWANRAKKLFLWTHFPHEVKLYFFTSVTKLWPNGEFVRTFGNTVSFPSNSVFEPVASFRSLYRDVFMFPVSPKDGKLVINNSHRFIQSCRDDTCSKNKFYSKVGHFEFLHEGFISHAFVHFPSYPFHFK